MSDRWSNELVYTGDVVWAAFSNGAHSATKFLSPKKVVKATQRLQAGRLLPKADENLDFVVTVGSPNYQDRLFIKDAVKAGEPFPVKKIHLRFPALPRVTAPRRKGKLTQAEKKVRSLAARVLAQTRQRESR